ncbi:hypothetical protein ONE63_005810 [Megalurothrips usitatus]|uniref:Uncharacterized protein n=1 Tax=Megalurothrips usitatus TaxID=439358 RepID=A0AAV7XXD7_9NEOP|nr:hypothetical protein ONE63_005810 [Megalurothrips usitatus]
MQQQPQRPQQPPAWAQVTVSFLPGPRPYSVALTTATVSRGAAAGGPNGSEPADCTLLRASNPLLDVVGHE